MSAYKLIAMRILVIVAALGLLAVGSAVVYVQLSKPQNNNTRVQTDVKTKDIIIKSERDISTATGELDAIDVDNTEDDKTLDDLSNGF